MKATSTSKKSRKMQNNTVNGVISPPNRELMEKVMKITLTKASNAA